MCVCVCCNRVRCNQCSRQRIQRDWKFIIETCAIKWNVVFDFWNEQKKMPKTLRQLVIDKYDSRYYYYYFFSTYNNQMWFGWLFAICKLSIYNLQYHQIKITPQERKRISNVAIFYFTIFIDAVVVVAIAMYRELEKANCDLCLRSIDLNSLNVRRLQINHYIFWKTFIKMNGFRFGQIARIYLRFEIRETLSNKINKICESDIPLFVMWPGFAHRTSWRWQINALKQTVCNSL